MHELGIIVHITKTLGELAVENKADYNFYVSYKITETKKSEITKSTYNWIDLKL